MRKKLYALTLSLCIVSCERIINFEDTFAIPEPCHVESILTYVGQVNTDLYVWLVDDVDGSVQSKYFNISVLTFDSIIGWTGDNLGFSTSVGQGYIPSAGVYCEESIPEVENHIHNWAKERTKESFNDELWSSKTRTIGYNFPYRLEGVTRFTITANQRFNGIEEGADLSDCFIIRNFSPQLFFSYDDYEAYTGGERIMTISEWLGLKPLASPCILLRLRDEIRIVAHDIIFTVTMTLTNGKVLTSNTPVVNIMK